MAEPSDRIADLLDSLTTDEKLRLVHGTHPDGDAGAEEVTGYLPPVERLGIPPIRMADGPLGVRVADATAFPASIALGASFDPGLAAEFGTAVGEEARAKGMDVLLAPGCNLVRVPQCGRTFEYYGEDPHHSASITAATVRGIQSAGVAATPKHYVANNQEHQRMNVSAEVSERALRELYLPAFEAAVTDGDAGAVMAAYNGINGTCASAHAELLTDVLKSEFGFDGPVMSDWWGVQDAVAAATAGLDLEMPGTRLVHLLSIAFERLSILSAVQDRWPSGIPSPDEALSALLASYSAPGGAPRSNDSLFAQSLPAALEDGRLSEDRLDEMVRRVLTVHERVGALGGNRKTVDVDRAAHRELAERVATRGTVLLQNDEALPLAPGERVAVVGPNADEAKVGGGGSSEVTPTRTVSPLDGIRDRSDRQVAFERGHPPIEEHSMFEDVFSLSALHRSDSASVDVPAVRSAVASVDAAVVVVQDNAAEARDRASLALPGEQDRLVATVADAAPQTVVVLQTAGPVEMPWLESVDAVLEAWYPGQEAGRAIASVLYGDADPGGRLPVTFAAAAGDYPANTTAQYPGIEGVDGSPQARYDEGVFVGYRHFDERTIQPLFPFGHGLSYAAFAYDDLEVSHEGTTSSVAVTVENTADCAGREVVQVYARDVAASVPRPPRELVGFGTVALDAGERRTVDIPLDERAFAFYDEAEGEWVVEPGEFVIEVGRSSRDPRATVTVERPA